MNSTLTASPICKPFSGGISVQNILQGPVYPASFAGYITLSIMSSESPNDQTAQNIAVASVRRHSMTPDQWEHTVIGCVHPKLAFSFDFLPGELPIVSGFFSQTS
ncbi:hypothetical protein [Acidovorax sp. 1608163]|uniref:hypothetical protein n=1 Tax=Acidovorax sp. 1608163 TaxID=2478662 RepID=UPI0013CE5AC7|nr:hypothetical protein [Acidovorax sp. 1608163]